MILDTPIQIAYYIFRTQTHALGLEMKGLRHSSGRSVYAYVKKIYHFTGTRAKVLATMEAITPALFAERCETCGSLQRDRYGLVLHHDELCFK